MKSCEVLEVFKEVGAILEGHFILTSGLHSRTFLQKARVFMHPEKTEFLCRALAEKIQTHTDQPFDYLVGPAIGGLIPAYETARHLKVPFVWVEREKGAFSMRRFDISPGAKVLIVDDIVTTGLSICETVECLRALGAEIVAAACIIDRSQGTLDLGVPLLSLAHYAIPVYEPENIPADLARIPAVRPGSRKTESKP